MKKKSKKLSKAKLCAIISSCVVILVAVAIIVVNVFIPVKYITDYFVPHNRAKAGVMRVSFIDVGYGDCIIIELPDGKNMIIDAGDGRYSNNSKVIRELNRRDIDTIDYLVCSSVNGEHCGGFAEVLKYIKVKTIYMPYCQNRYITDAFRDFVTRSEKSGAEIFFSEYNSGITADDYFFIFLSPHVKEYVDGEYAQLNDNPSKAARNNASAVTWLEYGGTSFLFTSDVEAGVLSSIVAAYSICADDYPVRLESCNIVQLANHGGEVSACAMFYDTASPEYAVISVGKNGSGSPSVKAMSDIIQSVGQNFFRTDECGDVIIEVTLAGYTVK